MAMGGIGEAMLLGAAMGGGTAALTGGDPLKGALMGGLTGGAGSAIGGALGAATPAVESAVNGTEAVANVGTSMAPTVANANALPAANAANPMAPTVANAAAAQNAAFTAGVPPGVDSFQSFVAPPSAPVNIPYTPPSGISALPAANATPQTFGEGMAKFANDPMASLKANPFTAAGAAIQGAQAGRNTDVYTPEEYNGPLKRFRLSENYRAPVAYADGGIATLASGEYDRMVGEAPMYPSNMAKGGISDLGGYSDGGRMLRGPGDGMSDSIPASIAGKRPARLATQEFVVPADVVSHLGNGSSDAGAKQLYAMMDRVRQARTGRKSQGREINPQKYMPTYA